MSLRARTRAALFDEWERAGFPAPRLERDRDRLRVPPEPGAVPTGEAPPLHPDVLSRVHGFGVAAGWAMGRLLGLDDRAAKRRATWCGRFNVGISLYDYVCDESGRGEVLLEIEPFASLMGRTPGPGTRLREEEAVLRDLATSLLSDLAGPDGAEDGPSLNVWEPRTDLVRLQEAQQRVAGWVPGPGVDLAEVEESLRAKSVDPFVVMAGWMVARAPGAAVDLAPALGDAVGRCVWVVDDAADLWRDLDATAWNLFLVRAAAIEPALLTASRTTLSDIHLDTILERHEMGERAARDAVAALSDVVARCPGDAVARHESLSLLGAGLAAW